MNEVSDTQAARAAAWSRSVPETRVDFGRPLVCILGLPFDAVSLLQAVTRIREDAFSGRRCFVSTPNLNFAITARSDAAFRDSVLRSDLSLIDGMPLVWLARLLRLPVRQRVSGADVFEALQAHGGPPLKVFFFGAPPGVAARACERVNHRGGGIRCVGWDEAGFGSVESMSGAEQIERINASGAHFVIVALGAQKGQAWIERNAVRLTAPVLSHLGAVVNFAAGEVSRAPRWLQRCGGEWLWRIKEERGLWRRYGRDGVRALGLICQHVLPDVLESRRVHPATGQLQSEIGPSGTRLRLHGAWQRHNIELLSAALGRAANENTHVAIDVSNVDVVDNCFVAVVLVGCAWFGARGGFEISGANRSVSASFRRKLASHVLVPRTAPPSAEVL